jgi:uncharacterized protein (TIGR01777 family)
MSTVLIAGGTGLIGQRLSQLLKGKNYEVLHLSRHKDLGAEFPAYQWDLKKGTIDEAAIEKADYIVNFAGAGIADKPWTKARKQLIIDSRVDSTRLLKKYIAQKKSPLRAYIAASAVGYYGNRGEQLMKESDPPGSQGFLSESVKLWENAIQEVASTGTRTAVIRIGIVLSTQGGALEKILLPFKFFNGAYFGDGQQWVSWIHIDDLCQMFVEAIENEQFKGVYNGVSPHPARNKELVFTIKKALGKPAVILPVPEFALRLALGQMADTIFESTKVASEKIEKAGFGFQFPHLEPAIRDLLERKV